jgi:hypothetical protein
MLTLINQFLEAKSNREINDLVNQNLDVLNANPRLYSFVRNARKRINRIKREQKDSWKIYQMN